MTIARRPCGPPASSHTGQLPGTLCTAAQSGLRSRQSVCPSVSWCLLFCAAHVTKSRLLISLSSVTPYHTVPHHRPAHRAFSTKVDSPDLWCPKRHHGYPRRRDTLAWSTATKLYLSPPRNAPAQGIDPFLMTDSDSTSLYSTSCSPGMRRDPTQTSRESTMPATAIGSPP